MTATQIHISSAPIATTPSPIHLAIIDNASASRDTKAFLGALFVVSEFWLSFLHLPQETQKIFLRPYLSKVSFDCPFCTCLKKQQRLSRGLICWWWFWLSLLHLPQETPKIALRSYLLKVIFKYLFCTCLKIHQRLSQGLTCWRWFLNIFFAPASRNTKDYLEALFVKDNF